ncbi:hypothetical protein [Sphingosinithalassobacter sp. LHW66-3]|uniref:hypothetical protein n=1 Tax=Sphingosinithalassobacter sp. LHW66-3 TaxID=3424718 RepID=UPI003D6AB653
MTDKDPWFTTYRGPGLLRVVPRNAKGWGVLLAFLLVTLAPLPLVIWVAGTGAVWIVMVPYLLFVAIACVLLFRLSLRRSEVIDIAEMARELKEFRKWREDEQRRR